MQQPSFEELLNRKEDLHCDLLPYVSNRPHIGEVLQHPLMYEVPYRAMMNALINVRYQHKLDAVRKAKESGNFGSMIALHERPWRWEALLSASDSMTDEQLAEQFAWVWIDSENIWQNREIIERLIHRISNPRLKATLMDEDDLKHYQELPDVVRVYRGCSQRNKRGLSWTQDRERAEWFATRLARQNEKTILITGDIIKEQVLLYTNGRNESEIVACDRNAVRVTNQEMLT